MQTKIISFCFRTLTEKIVAALPKMKCPCLIEPHQIQGLDFINIFPVIQWLVKRSVSECSIQFKILKKKLRETIFYFDLF